MNSDNQSSEGTTKNITLGLILSWIVGVLFILAGIGAMVSNPIAGILILLGGLIMVPLLNEFLHKKYNVNLSGGVRFLIAIVLVGIGIAISTSSAVEKAVNTANPPSTQTVTGNNNTATDKERLELVSYSCNKEYGYFTIKGQVKNITDKPLKDVQAVGSIYTDDGTFVKSDSALVEYNPMLPGQTSPFTVMSTDNPAASKCQIEFKEFFGGTIPTKRSDK